MQSLSSARRLWTDISVQFSPPFPVLLFKLPFVPPERLNAFHPALPSPGGSDDTADGTTSDAIEQQLSQFPRRLRSEGSNSEDSLHHRFYLLGGKLGKTKVSQSLSWYSVEILAFLQSCLRCTHCAWMSKHISSLDLVLEIPSLPVYLLGCCHHAVLIGSCPSWWVSRVRQLQLTLPWRDATTVTACLLTSEAAWLHQSTLWLRCNDCWWHAHKENRHLIWCECKKQNQGPVGVLMYSRLV